MSLIISGDLRLRNQLPVDADADAYIAAVEAADGQALEPGVKFAIKNFVLCCKQDGIWTSIKASCILAGARTLSGALVPLVGTAPTNFNFVSGDYNRKTGLMGNASTKYLNSNRASNADPNTNVHLSIWVSTAGTSGVQSYIGTFGFSGDTSGAVAIFANLTINELAFRSRNSPADVIASAATRTGFMGQSRSNATDYTVRSASTNSSFTRAFLSSHSLDNYVFARNNSNAIISPTNARFAFYSIGESLDLALLDARVTDLINAFAAAIP